MMEVCARYVLPAIPAMSCGLSAQCRYSVYMHYCIWYDRSVTQWTSCPRQLHCIYCRCGGTTSTTRMEDGSVNGINGDYGNGMVVYVCGICVEKKGYRLYQYAVSVICCTAVYLPEHILFPPPFSKEKSPDDFHITVQFCKLAVILQLC